MATLAPDDRDLALPLQKVEHVHDLVGAVPAVGWAGDFGGVRDVGCQQRPLRAQPRQHVGAEPIVRLKPLAGARPPRPLPHAGEHERQQAHLPERAVELEQQPIELDVLRQLRRLIPEPDPRPQDRVLGGRDRGGRVDLDGAELLRDLHDIPGPVGVEQLRAHDDASGLVACELVDHAITRSR